MKKLVFILFFVPFVLIAQDNFSINGQIGKVGSPAKVFLVYSQNGAQIADSSAVKNGAFGFTGRIESTVYGTLVLDYKGEGLKNLKRDSKIDLLPIYVTEGSTSVKSPDSLSKGIITGTEVNIDGQRYAESLKATNEKILALNKTFENTSPEKRTGDFMKSLQDTYQELVKERNDINKKFIQKNAKSFVSFIALQNYVTSNPEAPDTEALFNSLSADIKNSKDGLRFRAAFDANKLTAIGSMAQDFTQSDPKGIPVKLSSFRGKYVLIDFWASWCGPCRQENPNVVKAHNAYKDKNFTVLGVSLDRQNGREAWIKAIQNDKLDWTHVSDLKFWNNEAAMLYGVKSIPQNFLVDPEGKIIAKNLRGEELMAFLEDVLNQQ